MGASARILLSRGMRAKWKSRRPRSRLIRSAARSTASRSRKSSLFRKGSSMSLPELRPPVRVFLRAFFVLAMGPDISGCIQPLYGSLAAGGDVASELQAIKVDDIPGRTGHYLGNELIFDLNGTGAQVPAKYHLAVTVFETVQTPLLDTVTG